MPSFAGSSVSSLVVASGSVVPMVAASPPSSTACGFVVSGFAPSSVSVSVTVVADSDPSISVSVSVSVVLSSPAPSVDEPSFSLLAETESESGAGSSVGSDSPLSFSDVFGSYSELASSSG